MDSLKEKINELTKGYCKSIDPVSMQDTMEKLRRDMAIKTVTEDDKLKWISKRRK